MSDPRDKDTPRTPRRGSSLGSRHASGRGRHVSQYVPDVYQYQSDDDDDGERKTPPRTPPGRHHSSHSRSHSETPRASQSTGQHGSHSRSQSSSQPRSQARSQTSSQHSSHAGTAAAEMATEELLDDIKEMEERLHTLFTVDSLLTVIDMIRDVHADIRGLHQSISDNNKTELYDHLSTRELNALIRDREQWVRILYDLRPFDEAITVVSAMHKEVKQLKAALSRRGQSSQTQRHSGSYSRSPDRSSRSRRRSPSPRSPSPPPRYGGRSGHRTPPRRSQSHRSQSRSYSKSGSEKSDREFSPSDVTGGSDSEGSTSSHVRTVREVRESIPVPGSRELKEFNTYVRATPNISDRDIKTVMKEFDRVGEINRIQSRDPRLDLAEVGAKKNRVSIF